jgi:hypothetical protein
MLRLFIALGLLLSFLLLAASMMTTWREEPVPAVEVAEKTRSGMAAERRKLNFYPPVPARLPDLNKGYIFNEPRYLADEKSEEGVEAAADATLDEVSYIGSVISGERRIGIIAYAEKNPAQQLRVGGRGRPLNVANQVENKHVRVVPGETFGGYTVAEVLPDRLLFEKDGMKIEKLLAADKERKPPPAQLQGARRTQRQSSSQSQAVSPRRVAPGSMALPGIRSGQGRTQVPELPVPNGQSPGTMNQNSQGGEQPQG